MISWLYKFLIAFISLTSISANDKHWAYVSPQVSGPPIVQNTERISNTIDSFILNKLEKHNLNLSPEASKRELIRRLYFDLIGLPPTWEEVENFVKSQNPKAYENLVDKLLEDSRYGEKWARYWLDLARYADTAGYEGDPDLPYAWRYRDYVIDSLNRDKPYDLFIKEQIAGDEFDQIMGAGEIPLPSAEQTVALTFLRLAPFTEPRGDETRHEMLSEMTSTVGSVFLGLTIGCAKCHDHKYDNIPIKDFYRMKAFFSTIQIMPPERGDAFQIGGALPAAFYKKGEAEWIQKKRNEIREIPEKLLTLEKRLRSRIKPPAKPGFGLQSINAPTGNNYIYSLKEVTDKEVHFVISESNGDRWMFFVNNKTEVETSSLSGSNTGDWFGDINKPNYIVIGEHHGGKNEPAGLGHKGQIAEILVYDHPLSQIEKEHISEYVEHNYHDQGKSNSILPPKTGLRFWLDSGDLDANPETLNPRGEYKVSEWVDKIAGLKLQQPNKLKQPTLKKFGKTKRQGVHFSGTYLKTEISSGLGFLKDQTGAIVVIFTAENTGEGYGFEVGGDNSFLSTFVNPSAKTNHEKLEYSILSSDKISTEEKILYKDLKTAAKFSRQNLKRLEPKAMSLRHSFGPPYEPGVPSSRIMLRGEYNKPGEIVEAGFPSAITGHQNPAKIRLDPFKRWPTRSRRMALAEWIANKENPLTARVIMNRLWLWHFGRGIVKTPSDFGKLGGAPTHPKLLDWLAIKLVKSNWSLKSMHKLIVMSSTYKQSSISGNSRGKSLDPENNLLWKFRRKRLEAEAIRDSILSVSGRLNPEQYGLPIFPPLPDGIEESVKYSNSKWSTQHGADGRKRSIYIYQQRTLTMPLMQSFDSLVCEESKPLRQNSITALQALAMYNGGFVNLETKHFAKRVQKLAGQKPENQIDVAYNLALGRGPSDEERRHMKKFMLNYSAINDPVEGLCRVLFNSNEFIYID